ncbi:hypothetical protein P1P68_09920 [Streptomyces scabiei]|uniref:hypothetical protein n=1 Tax=Streptomyces scabiei TaxID=1930 RepID=UPI00298F6237|nr:hypothetical protein [Streptomyces scabiei]MDW8805089.1 hypothetical protein [Streptomyces scabiei]
MARRGARGPWTAGLLLVTTGLVVLAQLDADSSYWLVVGGLVPLGAGMGLATTPAAAPQPPSMWSTSSKPYGNSAASHG